MFPWPDALIELPDDPSRAVEFITSLLSEPTFISETRTRNVAEMCRRHDWRYRIRDIYQELRLPLPDSLKLELQALAALELTSARFRRDPGATVTGIMATKGASTEPTIDSGGAVAPAIHGAVAAILALCPVGVAEPVRQLCGALRAGVDHRRTR